MQIGTSSTSVALIHERFNKADGKLGLLKDG